MSTRSHSLHPHPRLSEFLFACKRASNRVFYDILGLHDIDHLAITWVTEQHQLIILSSTPALEFNLFQSEQWRFDRTYSLDWMAKRSLDNWHNLYHPACYQALHYIKQVKTHYRHGCSQATLIDNQTVVFSYARITDQVISGIGQDLYKMGLYCAQLLQPFVKELAIEQRAG